MSILLPKNEIVAFSHTLDPIDGLTVEKWKKIYKDRKTDKYKETRLVDSSDDEETVYFTGPIIKDLLNKSMDETDYIVFKFVCDYVPNKYFSRLNITPVIMAEDTISVKEYSNYIGNNGSLGSIKKSEELLYNYEIRKRLMDDTLGFYYDVSGIAYPIKKFRDLFKACDYQLSIYFMIDHYVPFKPKTNIAITAYNPLIHELLSNISLEGLELFDRGTECCPIGKK